jgi:hypothetical protein
LIIQTFGQLLFGSFVGNFRIFIKLGEDNIILSPINEFTNDGIRIRSNYASANQFRLDRVQQSFGLDTYPICISVNYDSMALESIGKRSLKPLKISILNLKRTGLKVHDNVITIASGPDLPYTDMEYQRLLSRNFQTSTKIGATLQYIKRYADAFFHSDSGINILYHHILSYYLDPLLVISEFLLN